MHQWCNTVQGVLLSTFVKQSDNGYDVEKLHVITAGVLNGEQPNASASLQAGDASMSRREWTQAIRHYR